jgi:pyruvate ferredoxin oxidoreductase alpha subunit
VKEFVGEYEPAHSLLTPGAAMTYGAMDFREDYFEHKRQQQEGLDRALAVTEAALTAFGEVSGRGYQVVEPYLLDDAEVALVMMGSADGVMRAAVDTARRRGVRAGLLRVRLLRPFPSEAVAASLGGVMAVGVLDRAMAAGAGTNPLAADVMAALWDRAERPLLRSYVYGLGGRVTTQRMIERAVADLRRALDTGRVAPGVGYLGLREERRA